MENQQILSLIIELNSKIEINSKKTELSATEFTNLCFLRRHSQILTSLKKLLADNNNDEYNFGIAILLRCLIADLIIIFKYYKLTKEFSDNLLIQELNKFSETALNDGLKLTLSYFRELKEKQEMNELDYNLFLEKFKQQFANFINQETQHIKVETKSEFKKINIRDIYNELSNFNQTKNLAKIYDSYQYYSKFEHFGIYYYLLQKQPSDLNKSLNFILYETLFSMAIIIDLLLKFDTENSKLKIINEEIELKLKEKLFQEYSNNSETV